MKRLLYYFIQGLLYTTPIAITIYLLWSTLSYLDDLIPLNIPGLGLLSLIAIITFIGFIGGFTIKFRLVKFLDRLLKTVPLVKIIYSSVNDIMKSMTGKKKGFQQPVLGKSSSKMITVYVPHSLAISGQVFVVPENYVEPLDVNSSEVMKYIIAGGVTGGS